MILIINVTILFLYAMIFSFIYGFWLTYYERQLISVVILPINRSCVLK